MIVSEFLTHVSYALRGTDDDAPTVGTDEATYWVATYNRKKDELYRDVKFHLSAGFKTTAPNEPGTVATTATTTLTGTSSYFLDYKAGDKITVSGETVRTIATITSNTVLTVTVAFSNTASAKTFTHASIVEDDITAYSLHRRFLHPSDRLYVLKTDNNKVWYDFTLPQARDESNRQFYISSDNPKLLVVSDTFGTDESVIGGTLIVPGYYLPDDVSDADDVIELPDPYWGVMATATEIAFNDVVYEDKAPDLNDKANNLFSNMVRANRSGTFGRPRTTPYNVNPIGRGRSL